MLSRAMLGLGLYSLVQLPGCTRSDQKARATNDSELAARPAMRKLALTFDDLGATPESAEPGLSRRILQVLKTDSVPATVFANCEHLSAEVTGLWQAAGMGIGNHTQTHMRLVAVDPSTPGNQAWWNDVTRCHVRLERLWGQPPRFFRFAYLQYGDTAERRDWAAAKLKSVPYQVAHVTASNSEWQLAEFYDEAFAHGATALQAELSRYYVEHMVESMKLAERLAEKKAKRPVPHITLVHVNRLAADHLGDVLSALRAEGWSFITLTEALSDPVFRLADEYAGWCACSWLERIAPPKQDGKSAAGDEYERVLARFKSRIEALSHK